MPSDGNGQTTDSSSLGSPSSTASGLGDSSGTSVGSSSAASTPQTDEVTNATVEVLPTTPSDEYSNAVYSQALNYANTCGVVITFVLSLILGVLLVRFFLERVRA